jgi:hypothetical protein
MYLAAARHRSDGPEQSHGATLAFFGRRDISFDDLDKWLLNYYMKPWKAS